MGPAGIWLQPQGAARLSSVLAGEGQPCPSGGVYFGIKGRVQRREVESSDLPGEAAHSLIEELLNSLLLLAQAFSSVFFFFF